MFLLQEQAAQLRAQQDKLTALSRRVLKHKGQAPSHPSPSSHLSPPPVHHNLPERAAHASQVHPRGGAVHALRSSASSSHGEFTVRRSSRSALASGQPGAPSEAPSEAATSRPASRSSGGMAALPVQEIRMHGHHAREQEADSQISESAHQAFGCHEVACGPHGGHVQTQPLHRMNESQNGQGTAEAAAAFQVRHTSSAPHASNPDPMRRNVESAARDVHATHQNAPPAPFPHPRDTAEQAPSHDAFAHAPQATFPHTAQPMHATYPVEGSSAYAHSTYAHQQQFLPPRPAGMPPAATGPSMSQLCHPVPDTHLTGGVGGSGMFPGPPQPQFQAPQTDVQSAVSELLQTLSETRQRHAAAVQSMHGHSITCVEPQFPDPTQSAGVPFGMALVRCMLRCMVYLQFCI